MAVVPGQVLQQRYRLDALIGRGGMGQVFSATDLRDGAEVAVKVVSRVFVDDTAMVRLHREAEAAARIRSDYVPRVLEVSDTSDRELFLVMDRLHGEPLSQMIRQRGALPWSEVRHIAEDVLRGLIDAHTAGIVHRDLKPSNVFLSTSGGRFRAFVLDFGVCKLDTVDHERLTATGESIGTVAYMAPEQIRGAAKVDDRADLYAFGALVFELLTGRLPHEGPSQMAILASKLEKPAARLADHALVEIPEGLDALVAKALARAPDERFASAQELLKAWRVVSTGKLTPASEDAAPLPPLQPTDAQTTRIAADQTAPLAGPLPMIPVMTHVQNVQNVPFETHPTQTALTTAGGSAARGHRSSRVVIALAVSGMVLGLSVVGISIVRAPSSASAPSPSSSSEAEPLPAPATSTSADLADDLDLPEQAAVVLVTDAGAAAPAAPPRDARKPVHRVRQPRRVVPRAPPAASTQHITVKPRY